MAMVWSWRERCHSAGSLANVQLMTDHAVTPIPVLGVHVRWNTATWNPESNNQLSKRFVLRDREQSTAEVMKLGKVTTTHPHSVQLRTDHQKKNNQAQLLDFEILQHAFGRLDATTILWICQKFTIFPMAISLCISGYSHVFFYKIFLSS